MHPLEKSLLGVGHRLGLVSLLQVSARRNHGLLYVLAYHRVTEPTHRPELDATIISALPEQFAREMKLLAEHYHPVSAEDVLAAVEGVRPLPRDAVLVTVDDGYCDFKEHILPAAQQYGIRPVLFVPTAHVGKAGFWWDRVYAAIYTSASTRLDTPLGTLQVGTPAEKQIAVERLRWYIKQASLAEEHRAIAQIEALIPPEHRGRVRATLDWDELRALDRAGVTIASHTHTHPILSKLAPEQVRAEIRISRDLLASEIGHVLPIFAYPDGKPETYNAGVLQVLREEGIRLAFTMTEGMARLHEDDPLRLPRLAISARMTLGQFHLHLTPAYMGWKRRKR